MQPSTEPLLRPKLVAAKFGVSVRKLYQLPVPRVRLSARVFRYRPEDVEQYLAKCGA
jgi:predicted DNA-binding transcriptional regulator AlpA